MINPRNKIEQLKEEIRAQLEKDVLAFKRGVLREIDSLWRAYRQTSGQNIDEFADLILQRFKLPAYLRNEIINDLQQTQFQIGELWTNYFDEKIDNLSANYEKLVALYQVDFTEVEYEIRDTVVNEVRKSVAKNYSFEVIRTNLLKTSIGTHHAYTLANTAVSQFDNASMFEFALAAGINEFVYDRVGGLTPHSRIFCIEHHKKVYTYQEILQLNNGQGVPVVTSCGGYNCQDFWSPKVKIKK